MNREEITSHITRVMCELFGLQQDAITMDARLYEDLDIDSIDAVDLVVEMKRITGKKINPEDFKAVAPWGT